MKNKDALIAGIGVEASLHAANERAAGLEAFLASSKDAFHIIEEARSMAVEPFAAHPSQAKIVEHEKAAFSSYATQPLYIAKFKDAFVFGTKSVVANAAGVVMREAMPTFHHVPDSKWMGRHKGFSEAINAAEIKEINEPVLLLANASYKNYWHWHVQALPNVLLYTKLGLFPRFKLLSPPLSRWQKDSLNALGVKDEQIITLEDRIYKVSEVYFSSLADKTRQVFQHPMVAETFQAIAKAHGAGLGHKKVYISRFDNDKRRPMVNEAQLAETLRSLGFHIIVPGVMSYGEQVETLKDAELVVGAHGAGMTNAGFAPARAQVIELFPRYFFYDEKLAFYVQSQLLRQHYRAYISREYPGEWEGKKPSFNSNAAWRVDIAECVKFIRQ